MAIIVAFKNQPLDVDPAFFFTIPLLRCFAAYWTGEFNLFIRLDYTCLSYPHVALNTEPLEFPPPYRSNQCMAQLNATAATTWPSTLLTAPG